METSNPYQEICNQYNSEKSPEDKMAHVEILTDFEGWLIMKLMEAELTTGNNNENL